LAGFFIGVVLTEFISFEDAVDAAADDLRKGFRDVLPFAAVVALTRTAIGARDALRKDEKRVFRNPTPYAINAPRAIPATKQTMTSQVILRNTGEVAAGNYLGPEIDSGPRHVKRFELALRAKGILPQGRYAVPGKAARLDQYGNMQRSQLADVLAVLNAYQSGGGVAKRVTRRALAKHPRRQARYFVGKNKITRQPEGIFQVLGRGKVGAVVAFVREPHYRERLDFEGDVRRAAEAMFPVELDRALTQLGPA
jgi:hypothetical protein